MAKAVDQQPHAALIPFPLQGHLIPAAHLATKLASDGFIVTFINTESVHDHIVRSQSRSDDNHQSIFDLFAQAREAGLDIRYETASDGFPLGFDRSLNRYQFYEGIVHVFPAHVDKLVGKLVASNPPVNCLIADTCYVWSSSIAKKYNLVGVSFWTQPALVFTLYYHLDLLRRNRHFGNLDKREDTITYMPGVQAIEPKDLTSHLQSESPTMVFHMLVSAFENVKKADFIICNTVQELESQTIYALSKRQPFYAIGPILPSCFPKSSVTTSLLSESDCTQWLNTKPCGSVLYVSFGSYVHSTKKVIEEMAYGLELSGVNFVWVLRADIISSIEADNLPMGYNDRIKDRGLIVSWCNQMAVISHPAIGAFLTHCGWNSIIESVWCGIPLICYPLLTDQFTNRKLVVDDWKSGINLLDRESISREEVAEKIKLVMGGKAADGLKYEIGKVRKLFENALSVNGSSQLNFRQFVNDVKERINQV